MKKLTVTIITLNEEKNIKRCLDSVVPIADEIVVVDSLSTDKTEAICNEYDNLRFVKQKWLGYSEQKNYTNDIASHDWIFSIDADEELSPSLQQSILEWKKSDSLDSECFSMDRLTSYCGKWIKHCGWYPDTKIRIWNRKVGRWKGAIHEVIDFLKPMTTTKLNGDLLHYSFETDADYRKQMFHFAEIGGKAYFEKGKKHAAFYCIVSPVVTFLRQYVFKLGFVDGLAGFKICLTAAKATHHKYATLKKLSDKR